MELSAKHSLGCLLLFSSGMSSYSAINPPCPKLGILSASDLLSLYNPVTPDTSLSPTDHLQLPFSSSPCC